MNLNLARKLRPKKFSEILGQEITSGMLKNSLFLDRLFPAYLFYGQRGCGKTTTARIFAKALNCFDLKNFRNDPKKTVPCLSCQSCLSFDSEAHPDFIEMDAASHTGVDNIRQILEAATYQPILGKYKIYLIDEAHMLSKAAFNAFLKILEEPPSSAVFILATTEVAKIPITVRSRCFLGFFSALQVSQIIKILEDISKNEDLKVQDGVFEIIVSASQGSARDAINIFEQLISFDKKITIEMAEKILQVISPKSIFELITFIIKKDLKAVLETFSSKKMSSYSPESIFNSFATFFSSMIKIKLGVEEKDPLIFGLKEKLSLLLENVSLEKIHALNSLFWSSEEGFFRASNKHAYIEFLVLKMAQQVEISPLEQVVSEIKEMPFSWTEKKTFKPKEVFEKKALKNSQAKSEENFKPVKKELEEKSQLPVSWKDFLKSPELEKDKVLNSILSSVSRINFSEKKILAYTPRLSGFFLSKLEESSKIISSNLERFFPGYLKVELLKDESLKKEPLKKAFEPKSFSNENSLPSKFEKKSDFSSGNNQNIDVSDQEAWPKANLLLKHFDGKIIEDE